MDTELLIVTVVKALVELAGFFLLMVLWVVLTVFKIKLVLDQAAAAA